MRSESSNARSNNLKVRSTNLTVQYQPEVPKIWSRGESQIVHYHSLRPVVGAELQNSAFRR
ncbi:hypothetical protein RHMOL_Rhmol07G0270200 [Rhododendron molle]|uniref:Uncharacterized protein n=1 Tax=Rhododendron molle TaxID=49168 RepID=A0ACC0N5X6_RHOML|nr:hypothetical protein RHMOL_Rhmol07G0270200 [Rhododendron molle]